MKSRQIKDEQKQLRPPKNLFLPHHPFFNEKWKRIQKVLQEKISDESSLLESYKTIHEDKNKNSWTVHSFSKFVSQLPSIRFSFFEQILPFIQGMILELPNLFPSATLPLSLRQKQQTIDLTRKQIACLLACSLFSLFENQPWRENQFNYPNFDLLFDHFTKSPVTLEKTKCILYYFQRMHERVLAKNEGTKGFRPDDIVRFHRRVLSKTLKEFEMELENVDEKTSLSSIQVFPNGTIEDDTFTNSKQVPSLQADFANKFIGGGVLRAGNVQEEIHFSVHTECLVSLLFCQVMDDNEAIYIVGAERFVETNGYARSFQVSGPFDAQSKTTVTPLSKEQIHEPALSLQKDNLYIPSLQQYTIFAFDATKYFQHNKQFESHSVIREIFKAYVAFSVPVEVLDPTCDEKQQQQNKQQCIPYHTIATGNWGCGAFRGDIPLKFVIQWIAASLASRSVHYYTFRDPKASKCSEFLHSFTFSSIQQLYESMKKYCQSYSDQMNFFEYSKMNNKK